MNFLLPQGVTALIGIIENDWIDLTQKVVDNKLPITRQAFYEGLDYGLKKFAKYPNEQVIHFIDSLVKHVVPPDTKLTKYLTYEELANILRSAVWYANFEVLKHFINTYDIDVKNYLSGDDETTMLHLAAMTTDLDTIKFLVEEKGIPVGVVNKKLETPLHIVVSQAVTRSLTDPDSFAKIVKYFVNQGASLEARDSQEKTPVDILVKGIVYAPFWLEDGCTEEEVAKISKTIVGIINGLIQHEQLSKETLNKYTTDIDNILKDEEMIKNKKFWYEVLTLPIRPLLPNFLKRRLAELCEGVRHNESV